MDPPAGLASAADDLEDKVEAQRLAQGMIRDKGGDVDAAAAAATAEANRAAAELAQAEAEAQAYAARAVSDMDEAVTRIRQEAAKRVLAAAERELARGSARRTSARWWTPPPGRRPSRPPWNR